MDRFRRGDEPVQNEPIPETEPLHRTSVPLSLTASPPAEDADLVGPGGSEPFRYINETSPDGPGQNMEEEVDWDWLNDFITPRLQDESDHGETIRSGDSWYLDLGTPILSQELSMWDEAMDTLV